MPPARLTKEEKEAKNLYTACSQVRKAQARAVSWALQVPPRAAKRRVKARLRLAVRSDSHFCLLRPEHE